MPTELIQAGFGTVISNYDNLPDAIANIKRLPTTRVYVFATYTAMLQLRKQLISDGYIKEGV